MVRQGATGATGATPTASELNERERKLKEKRPAAGPALRDSGNSSAKSPPAGASSPPTEPK